MNIYSIVETIKDAIYLHKKFGDYSQLEKIDQIFGIKLYQFQYFWEEAALDPDYLMLLLKYGKGRLYNHIFELHFLHKGKLRKSYHNKVSGLKELVNFLDLNSPNTLIRSIKSSNNYFRKDFNAIKDLIINSNNKEIVQFLRTENILRSELKKKQKSFNEILLECEQLPTVKFLYHLLLSVDNLITIKEGDLDFVINATNQLIYYLLKNHKKNLTVIDLKIEDKYLSLAENLLNHKLEEIKFNRNCIDVFRYDDNAEVVLNENNEIKINYKDFVKHERWRANGDKYNKLHNYYYNKSYYHLASTCEAITPFNLEYGQSMLYFEDVGLADYNIEQFSIEELSAVVLGLKHIDVWRDNILTIDSKSNFEQNIYILLKQEICLKRIRSIVEWLTYRQGHLNFGAKIFFKHEDKLILPNALLQHVNTFVPITNFLFKPTKNNSLNKKVAFNQGEVLLNSFKNRIPGLKYIKEKELPINKIGASQGEIDLALYDGQEVLIIEIKGSSVRVNLKDRKDLLDKTINKANSQLRKLRQRFRYGSEGLKWLHENLKVKKNTCPRISYIIATTSFEWDDFAVADFPKFNFFTLLFRLRNQNWFYNIDATEEYYRITKLDKNDLELKEVQMRIADFGNYYKLEQETLTIKSFLFELNNHQSLEAL